MDYNGHELESKYLVYINQISNIKNGAYGKNIFFWIVVAYLKISLLLRLIQLIKSYKHGFISSRSCVIWRKILIDGITYKKIKQWDVRVV